MRTFSSEGLNLWTYSRLGSQPYLFQYIRLEGLGKLPTIVSEIEMNVAKYPLPVNLFINFTCSGTFLAYSMLDYFLEPDC